MATLQFYGAPADMGGFPQIPDGATTLLADANRFWYGVEGGAQLRFEGDELQYTAGVLSGGWLNLLMLIDDDGTTVQAQLDFTNNYVGFAAEAGSLLSQGRTTALRALLLASDDTIVGTAGADILRGERGDDVLDGMAGPDTMIGGPGNDVYVVRGAGDVVQELSNAGFDVADTVRSFASSYGLPANVESGEVATASGAELVGNELNNRLYGSSADDTLAGGAGNDWLVDSPLDTPGPYPADADLLSGGDGNDMLTSHGGADTLDGGAGVDHVGFHFGNTGQSVVVDLAAGTYYTNRGGYHYEGRLQGIEIVGGSEGDDRLYGSRGADRLEGDRGRDSLDGRAGADTLVGGDGSDSYLVRHEQVAIVERALRIAGNDLVLLYADRYTLPANVEACRILVDGATVIGNAAPNNFIASDGDDHIEGGNVNFAFHFDQVDYRLSAAGVTVNLALTGPQDTGGSGRDTLIDIGRVIGSRHADHLTGSAADEVLNGSADDDHLDGGAGDDWLVGGVGHDTLTGGAGADIFSFVDLPRDTTSDHITDFGAADEIRLFQDSVPGLRPATLWSTAIDPAQFVANASGTAADADDRLIYETDTGRLLYDPDGTGTSAAVLLAILDGAPALSASDFFLRY